MRTVAAVLAVAVMSCSLVVRPAWGQSSGWKRPDLRPVSQPSVVGDRVVLYVAAGGGLRVLALDAATGTTVWSHDATTSEMAPGEEPGLAIMGSEVVYLAKGPDSTGAVTAVDAESGTELWSMSGYFNGSPGPCPDAPDVVCATGLIRLIGAIEGINRFDAATGKLLSITALGLGARELGEGLFDPGERHPERLIATGGERLRWSRPLRRIFPVGFTTDYGWEFGRYDDLGLFVGSVGSPPRRNGHRLIFDLAKTVTAAFATSNGRAKWRRPGWFECATLPCPADEQTGQQAPRESQVGLKVLARGTLSVSADPTSNAEPVVSRDARAVLQGFTISSGRTRWSFDAGRNLALINNTLPPQTAARTIVIRDARGHLRELDLERGTSRAAAPGALGWCRDWIEYHQNVGFEIDGKVITNYSGQQSMFPCSAATGRRIAAPAQVPAFVGDVGARSGNLIIWSDQSAVSATPVAVA